MAFGAGEVLWLVSGDAEAWLCGPPTWRAVNGEWRGEVPVCIPGRPDGEVTFWLMTRGSTPRRNKPTFALVIRGELCRRLDVNTPHRDLASTHIQGHNRSNDAECAEDASDLFPPIPSTGTVSGEQYSATFAAFAAHLGISLGSFEWLDEPDGRP